MSVIQIISRLFYFKIKNMVVRNFQTVFATDNELALYKALRGMGSGLPDQATHNGEFLTTDGTTASWVAASGLGDLIAVNNLSDVVSASTSLTNIGGLAIANNLSDVANVATANHNLGNRHSNYTPVFTAQGNPANTCDVIADSLVIEVDTDSVTFFVTVNVTLDTLETQENFVFDLEPLPNSNFIDKWQLRGLAGRSDASIFSNVFYGVVQAVSGTKTANFFVNTDVAGSTGAFTLSGRYHK